MSKLDQAAIRPGFFDNLPTLIREKQAEAIGVSEEELQIYSLSNTAGWRILAEFIDSLKKDLEQGTETAMAQGLPFEEIGRNAVVINISKGLINRILQKVEDAKEACERNDGTVK